MRSSLNMHLQVKIWLKSWVRTEAKASYPYTNPWDRLTVLIVKKVTFAKQTWLIVKSRLLSTRFYKYFFISIFPCTKSCSRYYLIFTKVFNLSFPHTIIYFYMVNLFDVRVKIVTKLNHSQNYPHSSTTDYHTEI